MTVLVFLVTALGNYKKNTSHFKLSLLDKSQIERFSLECRKVFSLHHYVTRLVKKLAPPFHHPIISKTKTNRDSLALAGVFPRFKSATLRSDEGLTLETSASESLYGGQFTLSTQLIKPNYLVILPPTQHHSFFRNLPPLPILSSSFDWFIGLERFSTECRKTKTKVIALANHKGHKQDSEPIKTRSNYM